MAAAKAKLEQKNADLAAELEEQTGKNTDLEEEITALKVQLEECSQIKPAAQHLRMCLVVQQIRWKLSSD